MKSTTYALMALTVLTVLFAAACGGGGAAPADQSAPPVQNPPADQSAPAAQSFAPACQAGTSCAAPEVADLDPVNTYCVEKVPYQNLVLDQGVTFESLDPSTELKCYDSNTDVDGRNVITCTGKELWTYQLKLTNTACSGGDLATGTGQCQDGFGYNAAQNCCAPLGAGGGGVTIIKVNIGACPTKFN